MSDPVNEESGAQGGADQPTRLAVLGAGPSALTALYHITADEETRARYDITVYQMGWRAGGKGASGRAENGRILEHGLHVLFGFYDNFFTMIRACYDHLDRPKGHPLQTWEDAFKGHNFGVVEDYFQDRWQPWALEFPTNDSKPGPGGPWDTEEDYVSMMSQALLELLLGWRALYNETQHDTVFSEHDDTPHKKRWTDPFAHLAIRFITWRLKKHVEHAERAERHKRLHKSVSGFGGWLWPTLQRWSEHSLASHRFWLGCDFLFAAIKGVIADRVFDEGGFNAIDHLDFREWLTQHGIHEITLPSPYCRTIYDAAFSYADGDPDRERVAAGAALRALFRMGFTYKGHAYYKMQAGMGDTVFEPLYAVLKERGVKFKYFHKIESLHLSPETGDGSERHVAEIRLTQQAKLANGKAADEYDPLLEVADLMCWPAEPLWDQIENAEAYVKSENPKTYYDLESYYERLPEGLGEEKVLRQGEDYDHVLYAIPIGAVPYLCREMVEDSEDWQNMVDHVKSVQTVAFQLWFNQDLGQLGWKLPSPLLSLYVEPLNTWADMSQVIPRETWPEGQGPLNISYYCGPQQGPDRAPDPTDPANAGFEEAEYAKAKELAIEFCRTGLGGLMPNAVDPNQPPEINWDVLLDLDDQKGVARFDSQYWRSNCGPSERCTLALPGATQYRMKADGTGYANLTITGDWIDNGLYVACMEGAITSGIYAARAITGVEYPIIGEALNRR